ncbi:MAG: transketolase [Deltaproteobacteria bacterium]|nr:transketolase [Deltaproteobacteria bacterium]
MKKSKKTGKTKTTIDGLCINTLRFLAVDAVEKARSGHPGMPMGDAAMAYVLWTRFLRHNPGNPLWPGRDRFVLSAGHGSMLLYSLLHLTGYDLALEELKNFRQWGSHTPGHPEYDPKRGVETTTGPLGQGFANGVGMAIAGRHLAQRYNRPGFKLFDYRVYAITSDGDLMEGISGEAASLAGHLGLGNIIYLYSDNHITIEGSTDLSFSEDVAKRFKSMGWHVEKVGGNDIAAVGAAIKAARKETARPSLIVARTCIGFGSPCKADTAEAHGAPLGPEEVKAAKQGLGWPLEPDFHIPDEALGVFRKAVGRGAELEGKWLETFERYSRKYPELAREFLALSEGDFDTGWIQDLPSFDPGAKDMATRSASGMVLNAIAPKAPFLIGGSADLAPSNNTYMKGAGDMSREEAGRNIHYGVREHAMAGIMNGLSQGRVIIPFGGTFLVFSDYMRPSIRLACLSNLRVVYVFTHDSIGLGEDGPTHQPVEHIASLRAMPNLTVIRPADAGETAAAWKAALTSIKGPVALILTRQNVPIIDRAGYGRSSADDLARGGYVIADPPDGSPEVIIMATGSEVHLALGAFGRLKKRGVGARVVSMPSWELFEKQDEQYRQSVLLPDLRARLAVEAGSPMGWHKYAGDEGAVIGITTFGASAPAKVLFEKYGFTVENIEKKAMELVSSKKGRTSGKT